MKHKSRRRLAAVNFLANVSLDGTYRDTKCASLFNFPPTKNPPDDEQPPASSTVLPNSTPEIIVETETLDDPKTIDEAYDNPSCVSATTESLTMRSFSTPHARTPQQNDRSPHEDRHSSRKRTRTKSFTKKSFESLFRNRHRSNSTSASTDSYTELSSVVSPRNVICLSAGTNRRDRSKRERVVLVTVQRTPFGVFSVLPYQKIVGKIQETLGDSGRNHSGSSTNGIFESLTSMGIVTKPNDDEMSFHHLLQPSFSKRRRHSSNVRRFLSVDEPSDRKICTGVQVSPIREDDIMQYDPNQLDDPEFMSGKHRTLMQLGSYVTSIIDYVRPQDLKRHLNEQFRERFPQIQLTLSKLRSLKNCLLNVGRKCHTDLWIISQAFVYFEKMILKNLITKSNRKWTCAACLLLSAKMNDIKGSELSLLIQELENTFRVSRRQLAVYEITVILALEFALIIPLYEAYPHYQRIDRGLPVPT